MAQRIASLFAEIGADTSKLVSGLRAAKDEISKTGKSLGGLGGIFDKLNNSTLGKTVTSLTGFQLSTLGAMAAVGQLANAVAGAVNDYSAYAESIDHLSARTGMASEEVSRLVQVSDDFRVSQETLERGMTLALQNGFNPTIDNLATLADRYNEIKDPTKRAAEMQDIFGRQWAELVPLLERGGDAIREASAGISDSLIVTGEAIRLNREYQASLDNLGDAWTGVKNEAAQGLIPSTTVFAKDLQMLMEGASLWSVLAFNQEEYRKIEERAISTEKLHTMALERSAESTRLTAQADAYRKKQLSEATVVVDESTRAVDAQTDRMTAQAQAMGHTARNLWEMKAGLEEYNAMAARQPVLLQAWQAAQTNLNGVMANFSQGYAQDVVGALQRAGLEGAKYEEALGAVDKQNGTNILGQHKASVALDEAAAKFESGEYTLEQFSAAIDANKSQWEALDENVSAAKSALDTAKESFDALMQDMASWSGKTFTIKVQTGGGGGGGGTKNIFSTKPGTFQKNRATETVAATGADFIVPPGYPNDTFRVGVTSFEHVKVTPANEQRGGAGRGNGGTTINIGTIVLPNVKNPNDFVRALRNGVVSGAGYAGG